MAQSCVGSESPHEEDRRDASQRGDADGARRRAVVARILGHRVNLERALVLLVADERRDDDLPRLALGSIVLGNINCRGRRASRLLVDHWRHNPRAGDLNSSSARKESPQLAYESPERPVAVVEDHEEEITTILLDGGLDDAERAAFCSVTRKDCRGDAIAEAANRQSIADLLAGINDDPPAAPAKRRRKKKRKPVAAEL